LKKLKFEEVEVSRSQSLKKLKIEEVEVIWSRRFDVWRLNPSLRLK
jgi:hypothetical protein